MSLDGGRSRLKHRRDEREESTWSESPKKRPRRLIDVEWWKSFNPEKCDFTFYAR